MLPGPVFLAELLTTARRARYYAVRALYGSILLALILLNISEMPWAWGGLMGGEVSIQEMSRFADTVFTTFGTAQSIMVLALTPVLVAGAIVDEKQRRTLDYLLASRLGGGEIVLGKLAARLLQVAIFLGVGLPIVSLMSLFGGIDPTRIVLVFAGTMATAFFLAGLAILVSTYSKKVRDAVVLTYMLEVAWLSLPPIVAGLFAFRLTQSYAWARTANDWLLATNPLVSITRLSGRAGQTDLGPVAWMIGLQVVGGAVFAGLATWRLRPVFQGGAAASTSRTEPTRRRLGPRLERLRRLRARLRGRWNFLPRPACGDDPVLWREVHVARPSGMVRLCALLLGLTFAATVAYWFAWMLGDAVREFLVFGYGMSVTNHERAQFNILLRTLTGFLYGVWGLGIAGGAASGVTAEREGDTWLSLIGTPLEAAEILRPKMLGAVWGLRWFGGIMLLLWVIGLVVGSIHPLGFLAGLIELTVFTAFAAALGTYISLRSKTSMRAQATTVAILVTCNAGYMMCCIPIGSNTALIAAGCTPFLQAISLLSYQELRDVLFGGGSSSYRETLLEMIAASVIGLVLYGLAALLLIDAGIREFDRQVGRPGRGRFGGRNRPGPPSKPGPIDPGLVSA